VEGDVDRIARSAEQSGDLAAVQTGVVERDELSIPVAELRERLGEGDPLDDLGFDVIRARRRARLERKRARLRQALVDAPARDAEQPADESPLLSS
jgi:hypothetical protein